MSDQKQTQTMIEIPKQEFELIERSPEAFPGLSLFPEGWDLVEQEQKTILRKKNVDGEKALEISKFPGATDAWI